MSIESVIAQTLKAWPALATVLVRPDKAEQGNLPPYLIYQKVTGQRVKSLAGDSGLANPTFQFDVYAPTRLAASSLRAEVRLALQANAVLGAVMSAKARATSSTPGSTASALIIPSGFTTSPVFTFSQPARHHASAAGFLLLGALHASIPSPSVTTDPNPARRPR